MTTKLADKKRVFDIYTLYIYTELQGTLFVTYFEPTQADNSDQRDALGTLEYWPCMAFAYFWCRTDFSNEGCLCTNEYLREISCQ